MPWSYAVFVLYLSISCGYPEVILMSSQRRFFLLAFAAMLAAGTLILSLWLVGGSVTPTWLVVLLAALAALWGGYTTHQRLQSVSDRHVITVGLATIHLLPILFWGGLIALRGSEPEMLFLLGIGGLTLGAPLLEYLIASLIT